MATETCKHATFLAPQWQALPTLQARKQGTTCHRLRNEPYLHQSNPASTVKYLLVRGCSSPAELERQLGTNVMLGTG